MSEFLGRTNTGRLNRSVSYVSIDVGAQSPQTGILRSQTGTCAPLGVATFRHNSTEFTQDIVLGKSDGSDSSSDSDELKYSTLLVYVALGLGVQAWMSYSGGATPAALPAIQKVNPSLSQFEMSLLGSLDKIGQVVASPLWGHALQRFPTKVLLMVGLITNAAFSVQFGFVRSKYSMFLSKFIQGCTESQQIVWGTLWVVSHAPKHLLSTWMNLGGVAAGVGTAIGQAVAGFGITAGMPYCFAYAIQGAALALLWLGLVFTPSGLLTLPCGDGDSTGVDQREGLVSQLRELSSRKLYWLTMICVAENMFIVGGLQFFWTRFFVAGPWTLNLGTVTAAGLLVQGAGMGLGIFLGPILVDKYGGYSDDLGRYVTLHLLLRITAVAVSGSGLAILAMALQLSPGLKGTSVLDSSLWNPWLWTFWFATLPINFALAAQGGVHSAINVGSVPQRMQALAQGMTTSIQFLLGYSGGVIVPSVLLDAANEFCIRFVGYEMTDADKLAIGVAVVCAMTPILFGTVYLAEREAFRIWVKNSRYFEEGL